MEIVDLTCSFDFDHRETWTPQYLSMSDLPRIHFRYQLQRDGRNNTEFTLATHLGTHVDVPYHTSADGKRLHEYPLEKFYGDTICLDIPKGERGEITAADLEAADFGIKEDDIVLIHTGWGKYFNKEVKNAHYLSYQHPGLVKDAAEYLRDKGIKAVGIDVYAVRHPKLNPTPTIEEFRAGMDKHPEPVHDILLGNDILIFEQLTNLDRVAGKRFTGAFLPLHLRNADGSPIRAIAILND